MFLLHLSGGCCKQIFRFRREYNSLLSSSTGNYTREPLRQLTDYSHVQVLRDSAIGGISNSRFIALKLVFHYRYPEFDPRKTHKIAISESNISVKNVCSRCPDPSSDSWLTSGPCKFIQIEKMLSWGIWTKNHKSGTLILNRFNTEASLSWIMMRKTWNRFTDW